MKRILLAVLALLIVILGIWWSVSDEVAILPEETLPEETVQLYFLDQPRAELVVVSRMVAEAPNASERVHQIFGELKQAPDTAAVVSIIPPELELHSVFFNEQTVYLDFNEELIGAAEGTSGEMYLLYSIVNSVLSNVSDRHKLVHFLVQGEMRKTIGPYGEESGHITIQYPLGPRWDLAPSS